MQTIFLKVFLEQMELVDVTLAADGHLFSAHRVVLSAFCTIFSSNVCRNAGPTTSPLVSLLIFINET